jgi:hypothetical protein
LFDVVALNLADYIADFDKSSAKQKKLVLQLKAAIESGTTNLLSILEKVIDLQRSGRTSWQTCCERPS